MIALSSYMWCQRIESFTRPYTAELFVYNFNLIDMPKIKKVNMWRTGSRLPSWYQEVEYIGSTWTQYINTWINYSNCPTPLVELRFKANDYYDSGIIWFWNGSNKWWLFWCSLNKFKFTAQSSWPSDYIDADDWWHTFKNTSSNWNIDNGTSISANTTMWASWYDMRLFKANNYNPSSSNLYISYCKIYSSDGILIRNFIPCYRTSDNAIGMYDLVYSTFYTNSWTWTFLKWNDINKKEYKVWPQKKWSVNWSTLLYMPLNWNVKDEVSWNNGSWWWTSSYTTLDSWLKVAYCNTSSYIITPTITMDTAMTVSWWLKWNGWDWFLRADRSSNRRFWQIQSYMVGGWESWWWYWYNSTYYWTTLWHNSNWWNHCVVTTWPNWVRVYSDWRLIFSSSYNSFWWASQWRWLNYDQSSSRWAWSSWWASNIIIEKRIRTEDEVKDYYEQTKSLYWVN